MKWESFTEIDEMACVTPAQSFVGQTLNYLSCTEKKTLRKGDKKLSFEPMTFAISVKII